MRTALLCLSPRRRKWLPYPNHQPVWNLEFPIRDSLQLPMTVFQDISYFLHQILGLTHSRGLHCGRYVGIPKPYVPPAMLCPEPQVPFQMSFQGLHLDGLLEYWVKHIWTSLIFSRPLIPAPQLPSHEFNQYLFFPHLLPSFTTCHLILTQISLQAVISLIFADETHKFRKPKP